MHEIKSRGHATHELGAAFHLRIGMSKRHRCNAKLFGVPRRGALSASQFSKYNVDVEWKKGSGLLLMAFLFL